MINTNAMRALGVESELRALEALGLEIVPKKPVIGPPVRLKRTFTMLGLRFWRIVGPATYPNYGSDLSLVGLVEWGVIPPIWYGKEGIR